jgi:tRNA threonylcarbamoyladenosine biosynthesis protein TsaB
MPSTLTLVIETSTPMATLAIAGPQNGMEEQAFTSDRSHNAVLFGPLGELLKKHPLGDIRLVLAGSGPGSYSGTRVGIAAAQGVAIAAGCPAVSVPSVLAVPAADEGAAFLVIGDARRGSFWHSAVENFQLLHDPELTDESGLEKIVTTALSAGKSVISFEAPDRFPLPAGVREFVRQEFPTASGLWRAWSEASVEIREKWAAAPPQPMYLKPPHITPAKRSWLVKNA